jgi:hypothetical protein
MLTSNSTVGGTMSNKEAQFKKIMGENINCWMWNFAHALPYVSNLVIDKAVEINQETNIDEVSKAFITEEYDEESVVCLLAMFQMAISKKIDLDFLGIEEEELATVNLTKADLVEMFANNPITVAQLYKEAQENFVPTYGGK